ncbi:MAG: hypothetical protein RLZZ408_1069 [Verrucomicrobiota bacterium]
MFPRLLLLLLLGLTISLRGAVTQSPSSPGDATQLRIPDALKGWQDWALWGLADKKSPTPYCDQENHLSFWPTRLGVTVGKDGGSFEVSVTVFAPSWVALPGGAEVWPLSVSLDERAVPVVEHEKMPSLYLQPGTHRIAGKFVWDSLPQRLSVPREIGLLDLTLEGKPVETPLWDAKGDLWLKRDGTAREGEKDFLSTTLYLLLEDGTPLILRTRVELVVSGKNREEEIGIVLPEGWKVFQVSGNGIPVAVDENGRLKAQVRPGKWTVEIGAFRLQDTREIGFAKGVKPAAAQELFAFRARPDFRLVDISGGSPVDASQTTIPGDWKKYPVYRWETASPIRIEERLRGMGTQKPEGLGISRQLWLDMDGKGCTFHDFITGRSQQIWRLDATEGEELGSVSMKGEGQLITRNPTTGAPGVEIRTRNLSLEATGRMKVASELSASGWKTDAGNVSVTLNLPPGWRLFALFGADWVSGDWLTAWNLLDLFLLLIFTLAVFRLWGFLPSVVAFLAFALSYHEPGAPRYSWLILLIPLALGRILTKGWGGRVVSASKWICIAVLLMNLIPFLSQQLQQTLYPQLERVSRHPCRPSMPAPAKGDTQMDDSVPAPEPEEASVSASDNGLVRGVGVARASIASPMVRERAKTDGDIGAWALSNAAPINKGKPRNASLYQTQNLQNDLGANIQTGPAQPTWKWRSVSFGWNGPVTAAQTVRPILVPLPLERLLTILRIITLLLLAGILLDARRITGLLGASGRGAGAVRSLFVAVFLAFGFCEKASADSQIPDQKMIETLRDRLLEPSTAYPTAAEIPTAALKIEGRRLQLDIEVHAALRTAVPVPGNLPSWSPLTVQLDGKPAEALRRADGFLWVVVPEGVHRIQVTGLLGEVTDWEWSFQLKPRRVTIEAPGWTVTGVKPNGVPEKQVFLSQKQKTGGGGADYDNPDLKSIALVERNLELGLVWHVHTTLTRKSPEGRAISLRIPLLPGENILSSNAVVKDGAVEVRLGAREGSYSWDSELPVTTSLHIASRREDAWTELWRLAASPVWNVGFSGLAPVFEPRTPDLIPVWHPWPGESVDLSVSRPVPVEGATVTVDKGRHRIVLGRRQRQSSLDLSLRCSVGQDFRITLPAGAQVTSLKLSGQSSPVRMEGEQLVVALKPGSQNLSVVWTTPRLLESTSTAGNIKLPVESSNITTEITVPDDRWTLWTFGPVIGPAVRFWGLLLGSVIAAAVLASLRLSPLKSTAWFLMLVGLTQVNLPSALAVVLWFFLFAWRGSVPWEGRPVLRNLFQLFLLGLTLAFLVIMIILLNVGLLGSPHMFIIGNYSNSGMLQWSEPRCGNLLPQPGCVTVSIWWYRLLMLLWALWLASSMVRWLPWAWKQFSSGSIFLKMGARKPAAPASGMPPIPKG